MADVRECMNALIHSDSDLLTEIDAAADQKLGRWLDRIVEGMKES
jgi:hypothetical protein